MLRYALACFTLIGITGCQTLDPAMGPSSNESRPGVIVLPTSGGVHHEPEYAATLSRQGFQTIVEDYHQSGYYDRIDEAYDKLRSDPRVGKIGIVGFSRGGYVAGNYSIFQHSIRNSGRKIDAIVGFYVGSRPPHVPTDVEAEALPPYLFLQGEKDNYIPPWQLKNFCARVNPNGEKCNVVEFKGVGHAFDQVRTKPYYSGYDRNATDQSYKMAVEWLNKWLR